MSVDPYYGFYSSGTYARPAAASTTATTTSTVTGGGTSDTTSNNLASQLASTQKAVQAQAAPGVTVAIHRSATGEIGVENVQTGEGFTTSGIDISTPKGQQQLAAIERVAVIGGTQADYQAAMMGLNYTPAFATPSPYSVQKVTMATQPTGYTLRTPEPRSFQEARAIAQTPGGVGGYSYYYGFGGKSANGQPMRFGVWGVGNAFADMQAKEAKAAQAQAFSSTLYGTGYAGPFAPKPMELKANPNPKPEYFITPKLQAPSMEYLLTPEYTGFSELGSSFGGRVGGALGGMFDIGAQSGKTFSQGKGQIGFEPVYLLKSGVQLVAGTAGFFGEGIVLVTSGTPEYQQYMKTGQVLPYAQRLVEFGATYYLAKKGTEGFVKVAKAGPEFYEFAREKYDPYYLRSADTTKGFVKTFKEPGQQLITPTDVMPIGTMETSVGKVRISSANLGIYQYDKIAPRTTSVAQASGKGLILEFEKPVEAPKLIAELERPGSNLVSDVKGFTGIDLSKSVENIKGFNQPVFTSIGISSDLKGTGYFLKAGRFTGTERVSGVYPIAGGESKAFIIPDKLDFRGNLILQGGLNDYYSFGVGDYRLGTSKGLLASKLKFMAETPTSTLFRGVTSTLEEGKVTKVRQIMNIQKPIEKPLGESVRFFDVPKPSGMKNFGGQPQVVTEKLAFAGGQAGARTASIVGSAQKATLESRFKYGFTFAKGKTSETKQTSLPQTLTSSSLITGSQARDFQIRASGLATGSQARSSIINIPKTETRTSSLFGTQFRTAQMTGLETRLREESLTGTQLRTSEITQQGTRLRESFITATQYRWPTLQVTQMRQTSLFGAGQIIPPIPIPFTLEKPKGGSSLFKFGAVTKGYRVFLKRGGKFRPISQEPVPKASALSIGIKAASSTLGRTFMIKPAGFVQENKPEGYSNLNKLAEFYKKGPATYIQKATFALSSFGEKREIKQARGKKRLFGLF